MDQISALLSKYESLIRRTAAKYSKGFCKTRHIGDLEDHISEARIAAWRALETYDATKQTKIETYMIGCIRNRLIDLNRKASRISRPDLLPYEGEKLTALVDSGAVADCGIEDAEDRIVFAAVLEPAEYETLRHLLDGGGINQLISARCRINGSKSEHRGEIVACLRRIQLKLESKGLSLSV